MSTRRRRRGLLAAGAALAAGVLAGVALGQEVIPIRITATVTPDTAGTPRHPRGVRIDVGRTIDTPDAAALPMPQSVDAWLPKGWRYNGAKHPVCTLATLTNGGPGACPPGSIVSHGPGGHADVVELNPPPRLTIINGGRTKVYIWVVLFEPARVQAAAMGTITKLHSPRWSYRLHVDVPGSLRVVAGIPVSMRSFHTSFGRGDWIATTSCPRDRRWRYHLRMRFSSGQVVDSGGSVACRR
jgi:hypothetical protein